MWPDKAAARPQDAGAPKLTSHSTIEKQRRDRINSLIDELRDIVPPGAGGEAADNRRPKHIVLSDTIALVKRLRAADGQSAVDATGAQDLHLPLAPDGAAAAFGIIVEQAADCCIVKVHCKDRPRLLLDTASALAELQMQVTTAAVTTTAEGNCFNVFRVCSGGNAAVDPQNLQRVLLGRLMLQG